MRLAEVEAEEVRSGMAGMPLEPRVIRRTAVPSKLFMVIRKISPNASVTMAR